MNNTTSDKRAFPVASGSALPVKGHMNLGWEWLVRRLTRRKRWEREVCEALMIARHAARKIRVEMERGRVEPKCEYDMLIALGDRLFVLPQGPSKYDTQNTSIGLSANDKTK